MKDLKLEKLEKLENLRNLKNFENFENLINLKKLEKLENSKIHNSFSWSPQLLLRLCQESYMEYAGWPGVRLMLNRG